MGLTALGGVIVRNHFLSRYTSSVSKEIEHNGSVMLDSVPVICTIFPSQLSER